MLARAAGGIREHPPGERLRVEQTRRLRGKRDVVERVRRADPLVAEVRAVAVGGLEGDAVPPGHLRVAGAIRAPGDRVDAAGVSAGLRAHLLLREVLERDLHR